MNWLHLLWLVPLILAAGYYLGTFVSAIKLNKERDIWFLERTELIARKDVVIEKLRDDIYHLNENNANLRRRCRKYELGED